MRCASRTSTMSRCGKVGRRWKWTQTAIAHYQLGQAFVQKQMLNEAIEEFGRGLMQSPFAKADRSSNSTSRGWAAARTTSHAGVPFSSSGKWSWVRCVAVSWPGQRDDAHVAGFLYSRGWRLPLLGWSWLL